MQIISDEITPDNRSSVQPGREGKGKKDTDCVQWQRPSPGRKGAQHQCFRTLLSALSNLDQLVGLDPSGEICTVMHRNGLISIRKSCAIVEKTRGTEGKERQECSRCFIGVMSPVLGYVLAWASIILSAWLRVWNLPKPTEPHDLLKVVKKNSFTYTPLFLHSISHHFFLLFFLTRKPKLVHKSVRKKNLASPNPPSFFIFYLFMPAKRDGKVLAGPPSSCMHFRAFEFLWLLHIFIGIPQRAWSEV